jgi:hypothetical protein
MLALFCCPDRADSAAFDEERQDRSDYRRNQDVVAALEGGVKGLYLLPEALEFCRVLADPPVHFIEPAIHFIEPAIRFLEPATRSFVALRDPTVNFFQSTIRFLRRFRYASIDVNEPFVDSVELFVDAIEPFIDSREALLQDLVGRCHRLHACTLAIEMQPFVVERKFFEELL